eukprot:2559275-Lingulodinium_polyedra.AAC.1
MRTSFFGVRVARNACDWRPAATTGHGSERMSEPSRARAAQKRSDMNLVAAMQRVSRCTHSMRRPPR